MPCTPRKSQNSLHFCVSLGCERAAICGVLIPLQRVFVDIWIISIATCPPGGGLGGGWTRMMGLWFCCGPLFGHNCVASAPFSALRAHPEAPALPIRWSPVVVNQLDAECPNVLSMGLQSVKTVTMDTGNCIIATSDLLASAPNKQSIWRVFKCLLRKQ